MSTPQPVRGTQSLIGEEADRFHAVIAAFDRVRRLFGFKRVEVPVIEQTEVFARSIGETTDVVSKEMYSFEDRGGEFDHASARVHRRDLPRLSERRLAAVSRRSRSRPTARRSATSGRRRAASASSTSSTPRSSARPSRRRMSRLLSLGRPAAEGAGHPDGVTLQLNTLGDAETRDAWRAALVEHFRAHRGDAVAKTASCGSSAIRCASSTARTRGPADLSTPRRRSTSS